MFVSLMLLHDLRVQILVIMISCRSIIMHLLCKQLACLCFLLALLYSSSPLLVVRELKETCESENKKAQSKIVDGYYMEDDGNYQAQYSQRFARILLDHGRLTRNYLLIRFLHFLLTYISHFLHLSGRGQGGIYERCSKDL